MSKQVTLEKAIQETKNAPNPNPKDDRLKSACIMACLDMETNFKLYSYRIISHENFIEKCKQISNEIVKL